MTSIALANKVVAVEERVSAIASQLEAIERQLAETIDRLDDLARPAANKAKSERANEARGTTAPG